jgi:hypothetical protein
MKSNKTGCLIKIISGPTKINEMLHNICLYSLPKFLRQNFATISCEIVTKFRKISKNKFDFVLREIKNDFRIHPSLIATVQ